MRVLESAILGPWYEGAVGFRWKIDRSGPSVLSLRRQHAMGISKRSHSLPLNPHGIELIARAKKILGGGPPRVHFNPVAPAF